LAGWLFSQLVTWKNNIKRIFTGIWPEHAKNRTNTNENDWEDAALAGFLHVRYLSAVSHATGQTRQRVYGNVTEKTVTALTSTRQAVALHLGIKPRTSSDNVSMFIFTR
jgi:hypothetical protein